MQLTADQKELCRRLREELDVTDAETIAAADLIEILTAHSAGAREPVVWRHKWTNDHAAEWAYKEAGPKTDELRIGIPGVLGPDSHRECWEPLYAQPQPIPQTDAARDAEDAKRYRFIKSQMKVGAVQTQLPLYRTLHWIGYEDCSDVHSADAAIDAEIERLDGAKGE